MSGGHRDRGLADVEVDRVWIAAVVHEHALVVRHNGLPAVDGRLIKLKQREKREGGGGPTVTQ